MGIMRRGVQYPLADCLVIAAVCVMVGWVAHGLIGPVEVDEPVFTDAPPPRGDGPIWEWAETDGDQDLRDALDIRTWRYRALLPEATRRIHIGLYVDKYAWEEEQRLDSLAVFDETGDRPFKTDDKGHKWVDNPVDVRVILAPVEGHRLSDAEHAEFHLTIDCGSYLRTIDNPFRRSSGWGGPNPSRSLPYSGDLDIWEADFVFSDFVHGVEQWQQFRRRLRLRIEDVGWMEDYNPPGKERLGR